MKVATVLRLTKLLPHQEMLKQKLLHPYNPLTMAGRIIFCSHQVREYILATTAVWRERGG